MNIRSDFTRRVAVAAALAILALGAAAPRAGAQDLAAWYADAPHRAAYGSVRAEVESLAAQLSAASLPDSLLASRLEEGSRKRIAPDRLVAALRADTARLVRIASALRGAALLPQDRRAAGQLADRYQVLLRAGATFEEFEAALARSVARLGSTRSAAEDSLAALAKSVQRDDPPARAPGRSNEVPARGGDRPEGASGGATSGGDVQGAAGRPGGAGAGPQGNPGGQGGAGQGQGGKRGK